MGKQQSELEESIQGPKHIVKDCSELKKNKIQNSLGKAQQGFAIVKNQPKPYHFVMNTVHS